MISLGKRSLSGIAAEGSAKQALAEAVQAFLLERRIAGATSSTIATYRTQLAPFQAWCVTQGYDLASLSVDSVRGYLATRQAVSGSALFEAARRLKTFFRWCHTEHVCEDLGARIRMPKQAQRVIPALTVPQVRALLAVCSKDNYVGRRDEALLRLLLDAGLRISEALGLGIADVDVADGRVLVRYGKGQKQRVAPFGPRTQRALQRYSVARLRLTQTSETFFIGTNGRKLTRRHIEQHVARIAKRAGIEGIQVSPHVLRHTCALWYLRRGGDAFTLQMLLGHSTLEMTKRYVAMTTADVSAAHAKFGAGELV